MKPSLLGLTKEELTAHLSEHGQPSYRTDQILDWVWKKRPPSIDAMSNLPKALRTHLEEHFSLYPLTPARELGSTDTTRKMLYKLHDGRYIESVLIPANPALYGGRADRLTLCVSSQVGCAYGCKFCASGLAGFARNLTAAEIAAQVLQTEMLANDRIDNLVFMGMGEPLANSKNLLQAIELITSPWGLNLGARHLTISTSGLVPQIRELARHPRQIRLAISLHGATDAVRDQIMPVNQKYPTAELFEALHDWNANKKQHLTLEYILIQGVNDDLEQARILATHARSFQAKVNLIPYNTVSDADYQRPTEKAIQTFVQVLEDYKVAVSVRRTRGLEADAACGQLRGQHERAKA